jgi:hypothetical protein
VPILARLQRVGIAWRKFSTFRGVANRVVEAEGRSGLLTEISRNVFDPSAASFSSS